MRTAEKWAFHPATILFKIGFLQEIRNFTAVNNDKGPRTIELKYATDGTQSAFD